LCARKSLPGGDSFHPPSSILYPLWLQRCRAAPSVLMIGLNTLQPPFIFLDGSN
jgi:hypothetical protein